MIKIYSIYNSRSDFISLQLASFKKNLANQFEFIICNNTHFDFSSLNRSTGKIIKRQCMQQNISHIDIGYDDELIEKLKLYGDEFLFFPNRTYVNGNIAHAYALCWLWKHYLSKSNDIICIIDFDMFFIDKIDIESLLSSKYDLMYLEQSRGDEDNNIQYIWPNLILANLAKLPDKQSINWWCGKVNGISVDVGGQTSEYLKNHKNEINIGGLTQHYYAEDINCNIQQINYETFSIDQINCILHYRAGSNWNRKDENYHRQKTIWLKSQLKG
jgi:hypothetical protein